MAVSNDGIKKALEILFNQMHKKGMIPPNVNKEKILENVFENLDSYGIKLTPDNLRDNAVRKALSLAIISEVVQELNPSYKFDYTKLFDKDLDNDKASKEFKLEIKNLFTKLNELHPDPTKRLNEKDIDALTNAATEMMMKIDPDNPGKPIAENEKAIDLMLDLIGGALNAAAPLLNLFGGADPRKTGMIPIPVLHDVGNAAGIVSYKPGDKATSETFIDRETDFDPKSDPFGVEASIHARLDALGPDVNEEFDNQNVYAPDRTPRFTPPGVAT